jgi:hypothetical protein
MTGFKIKPLYTVNELAEMAEVAPRTMRAMLVSAGVKVIYSGRKWYVPLSELELKMWPLQKSLERAKIYRESAKEFLLKR